MLANQSLESQYSVFPFCGRKQTINKTSKNVMFYMAITEGEKNKTGKGKSIMGRRQQV